MNKCKECGKEEWGYGSLLNNDGLCFNCSVKHINEFVQKIHILNEANTSLENTVGKLGEQLNEANKVIKFYSDAHKLSEEEKQMTGEKYHLVYGLKANDYLEKWGVK